MKCLVYGILREGPLESGGVEGIEGSPVSIHSEGGLAVVYSEASSAYVSLTLDQITAYARTVEKLHKMCTVLPMRYGCFVEGRAPLGRLLRERRDVFSAALGELEGCEEMSLRVLCPPAATPLNVVASVAATAPLRGALCSAKGGTLNEPAPGGFAPSPKANYLMSRQAYYAERESKESQAKSVAEKIGRAFEGVFVKSCSEWSFAGERKLLSVFFLVRRKDMLSFHKAFARFREQRPEKMLLTGPWPPYNFVPAIGKNGVADLCRAWLAGASGLVARPADATFMQGMAALAE